MFQLSGTKARFMAVRDACQCSRVMMQHRERVLQWDPDPFLSVSNLLKAPRSFSVGTEERPLTSSLRSCRLVKARCVFVSTAKRVCHFTPVDEMTFRPNTHTCVSMTTYPTHQERYIGAMPGRQPSCACCPSMPTYLLEAAFSWSHQPQNQPIRPAGGGMLRRDVGENAAACTPPWRPLPSP